MKFHPSKQLGQNFLINQGIVDKIIAAADLSKEDTVLEVGPGKGVLTEELVKRAGHVIAVEKDRGLYEMLVGKFKGVDNLELVNEDIFKVQSSKFKVQNYKIVANIPYGITGQFFQKFLLPPFSSSLCKQGEVRWGKNGAIPPLTPPLSTRGENGLGGRPEMIVVMVQKEVGERILGKSGRSLLTLAAELYGAREKICDVSPGSFNPPPKIFSVVIKFIAGRREQNEHQIMRLAKIGFSSKRKKLISNLSTGLKLNKKVLLSAFSALNLNENARAEELSKDIWLKLAEMIKI